MCDSHRPQHCRTRTTNDQFTGNRSAVAITELVQYHLCHSQQLLASVKTAWVR